jgi:hypothetical protein
VAPVYETVVVVAVLYHLKTGLVTVEAEALKDAELPLHIVASLAVIKLAVERGVTVTVTSLRPVVLAAPSQ